MQTDFQDAINDKGKSKIGEIFNAIINDSTDDQKAAFLSQLHEKGETPEEVNELATLLREKSTLSPVSGVSDIVGTGGDGMNTINVSTAASLVLSSMGVKIAKHGNFGATSNKGSADFLKYLGYNFEMTQKELERRIDGVSFAFILAPMFNNNFAKFARARKMLPHKTVFNFLGPLTNPANPSTMMLGVTDKKICALYTDYLTLNSKTGCVVYSDDGMDEISPSTTTNINFVRNGRVEETKFDPLEVLGSKIKIQDVSRIEPEDSFELTRRGLEGADNASARFISLNSAIALFVSGKCSSPKEGFDESMRLINSGFVNEHVERLVNDSRQT